MEEDMVSQLPDDILISIVTQLSTREAVRTSILAKEWRNAFKFVSTINISCLCRLPTMNWKDACDSEMIIDWLHRVSKFRSGVVRDFELRCCLTESNAHVFEECICSLGKGIEKLYLQFSCWRSRSHDFPFSCRLLLHMPSLENFKLRWCSLQPSLNSHCNSLKNLRLSKVRALAGSIECIMSNCLSLSSLLINDCEVPAKLCFRGSNLQLNVLMICNCNDVEEIELYTSNLITFEFTRTLSTETSTILFDHVPQLQNIYISSFKNTLSLCRRLGRDLPNLKSLVLLLDYEEKKLHDSSIHMGIDMLRNLKRLEVDIHASLTYNMFELTPLLHGCPLLQEFHLSTDSAYWGMKGIEKPVVIHSHLKKVDIDGFWGSECHMNFVLYLLRCGVKLEQVYLSYCSTMYSRFGEWWVPADSSLYDRWSEGADGYIHRLKREAVSQTVQIFFEKFPRAPQRKKQGN